MGNFGEINTGGTIAQADMSKKMAMGYFEYDMSTASGNLEITGVGFQPTYVTFECLDD